MKLTKDNLEEGRVLITGNDKFSLCIVLKVIEKDEDGFCANLYFLDGLLGLRFSYGYGGWKILK